MESLLKASEFGSIAFLNLNLEDDVHGIIFLCAL